MTDALTAPRERESIVGRSDLERSLRASIDDRALTNGWIIAGPAGSGKATLAYRLARAILEPPALADADSLQMSASARTFRLVANKGHPDLFVAERQYDEKNDRYETEITVETIRKLTAFLNKTAGFGGWRVAIIDSADEMSRQASNALLKSLEEPPPRTTLLLAANAPGRLLATIRSRCRRIDLRPVSPETIARLLIDEAAVDPNAASAIALAAQGRPGYALTLAAGDGAEAIAAMGEFFDSAAASGDTARAAAAVSGKAATERWDIFKELLLEKLSEAARARARNEQVAGPLAAMPAAALLEAHTSLSSLLLRGEAVNLDRRDLVLAMGRDLHRRMKGLAA